MCEIEKKILRKKNEIQKLRDKSILIFKISVIIVVMLIILAIFLHSLFLGIFAFILAVVIWFAIDFIEMQINTIRSEIKDISHKVE